MIKSHLKFKQSTIKDFAKVLGKPDGLSEYEINNYYENAIVNISVKHTIKDIFAPIVSIHEALYEIAVSALFLVTLPILIIWNFFIARKEIRLLYLYLIKHRKEIKAYKKYLQEQKESKNENPK